MSPRVLSFPPGYVPTPAERAVAEARLDVRWAAAQVAGLSVRGFRRALRANYLPDAVAAQLGALCGVSPWCFHPLALAREREEQPR